MSTAEDRQRILDALLARQGQGLVAQTPEGFQQTVVAGMGGAPTAPVTGMDAAWSQFAADNAAAHQQQVMGLGPAYALQNWNRQVDIGTANEIRTLEALAKQNARRGGGRRRSGGGQSASVDWTGTGVTGGMSADDYKAIFAQLGVGDYTGAPSATAPNVHAGIPAVPQFASASRPTGSGVRPAVATVAQQPRRAPTNPRLY